MAAFSEFPQMWNERTTTLPPPVPGNGVQNLGIIGRLSLWLYILLLLLLLLLLLFVSFFLFLALQPIVIVFSQPGSGL